MHAASTTSGSAPPSDAPGGVTRSPRQAAIAGGAVGALAAALWLLNDVSVSDLALFVAFELGFVVIPGCLAYLALSDGPRPALRVAVAGSALGFALEVGFYAAASAAGADAIFYAYPALVAVPALVVLRRRGRARLEATHWRPAELLGAVAVAVAALVVLAVNLFDQTPLPGSYPFFLWHHDLVFEIAIAGEAKHVWPLDVPALAGEPLRYHYFANLNEAAISEVTGMEQVLVNFRLAPIPLLLLVVGGLFELGRTLSGRAWGGILCAAVVLFVGPFDPLPLSPGEFFENLYLSDSFLFGLALFLPLACELVDRIRAGGPAGGSRWARVGPWAVVAILMLGCSGGKATILPTLLAGLGIALAYALWRSRGHVRALAISLGLAVAAFAVSYLALYRSDGDSSLDLVVFGIAKRTPEYLDLSGSLPDAGVAQIAANAAGSAAGILDVLGPLLVGLVALCFVPRLRSRPEVVFLLGALAAGAVLWSLLVHRGNSQFFFLWYGWAAAGAVGAAAIVAVVADRELDRRRILAVGGPIALALLALAAVAPRAYEREGGPVKEFANPFKRVMTTEALLDGLAWIRDNTPGDSVIAVNNGYLRPDLARNCSYTALSERRALLECEYGSAKGYPPLRALRYGRARHPSRKRFRLNERIFRGDAEAIREAHERYGVDYLVVDRRFAGPRSVPRLDRVASRAYEGPRVVIYSVEEPRA